MTRSSHVQLNDAIEKLRQRQAPEDPAPRFVSTLESRLLERFFHKRMPHPLFAQLTRRPWLSGAAAAVVVVALLLLNFIPGLRPDRGTRRGEPDFSKLVLEGASVQGDFTLLPTKSDHFGVAVDTAFTLKTKATLAVADLRASVAIAPEVPFTVTAKEAKEFAITPTAPLEKGTVYEIAIGSTVAGEKQRFSWAFQAKDDLRVDGTLPRHKASGVPVDTGIEVTFNAGTVKDFAKHFRIQPAIEGRIEQHGRVWAYVPKERLQPSALYTVTVTEGLPVGDSSVMLAADFTFQFETAQPTETDAQAFYGSFGQAFHAVVPGEAPVIDFSYASLPAGKVAATVFRFKDAADVIERLAPVDAIPSWAYAARAAATIGTDGLTKTGTYELTAESNALRFPSGFDAGYYLVDMTIGKRHLQTVLVSSELSGSLTVSRTDSLVWLSDLATDTFLADAEVVSSLDGRKARTDDQGIARFPTPSAILADEPERSRGYITVTAEDKRQTVLPLAVQPSYGMGWGPSSRQASGDFWSYLWTDRTLYRPTDTVNVWGVVRNRAQPKAEDVTLEIWTWNTVDAQGNYLPLAQETVTTGDFSSFSTSVRLEQLKPGYYTLSAKVGGKTFASRSFEVRTFQKPAYRILATPDKAVGIHGDTVTYAIRTEFFDGTPAPRITLAYASYGAAGGEGTRLVTDEQGRATVTETLDAQAGQYGSYGRMQHLTFFPVESVEGNIAADTDVFVYPSAVTFSPEAKVAGSAATVSLTLREVDLAAPPYWGWFHQDAQGKVVPNAALTGTVYEIKTAKVKTGERYDFLEKRVVDEYRYDTSEDKREDFTGTTDVEGYFTKSFQLTANSYRVEITASDAKGRKFTRSAYVSRSGRQYFPNPSSVYGVQDINARTATDTYLPPPTYKIGDTTDFAFTRNGETVETKGRFLFLKLQNGIRDISLKDEPRLTATMGEEDVPNVYYTAIWFDGGRFLAPDTWSTAPMLFDSRERQLTVAIAPDQEVYAPGDTAKLTIRTTDPAGKPQRAAVSVSAIDEALSAIQQENAPSPLVTLMSQVPAGLLQLYMSHTPLKAEYGAEGGGGGDNPRKNFKDAPLWTEVVTDANGTATVPFKLPDNITSWRVTAQGVTEDLAAGDTVAMVPVTKPVFGTLTMSDDYVVTDKPKAIAHAYGSALSKDSQVAFTFEAKDLGEPQTRTGKAFAAEQFAFPDLAVGTHEVKLTVAAGADKDTLVRTVSVVPSRLTRQTSRFVEAKPDLTLEGSEQERTTLVVSDTGRGRLYNLAQGLAWSYGKRLDRHLAARIARDVLKDLGAKTDDADAGFQSLDFQMEDGGIGLVVYGSADLPLSALAAARADLFDRTLLRQYLIRKLEDKNASPEQTSWALLGLAYVDEPVLPDLDRFLTLDGASAEDQLRIALAYLALGARDRAGIIAQALFEKYGETQDPFARLTLGDSADSRIVNTARFAILAEGLKRPERLGLDRFLAENFPKDALTNLERALAAAAAVPLLDDQAVSLRYRLEGKEEEVTLKNGETKALSLTPRQLKDFTVVAVHGPVGITALSVAPIDLDTTPKDRRLSLDRRYSIVGGPKRPIQEGDIVRIDFTPKVSQEVVDQTFFVTDFLPSGLVVLSQPWQRGFGYERDVGYPIEEFGQRVTFFTDGNRAFHYYARVLTPGSFAAEPAILQGQTSRDAINYSGGQTLEIR